MATVLCLSKNTGEGAPEFQAGEAQDPIGLIKIN